MKLGRIIRKLQQIVFQTLNRDEITYLKITPRKDLTKVGTSYGGWVIPKTLLDTNSICYCVGCGEDISFDLGLIETFDCHVFGFDPTPRAITYVQEHTKTEDRYHFSDLGLWDEENTLRFFAPKNPEHVSHSALNLQKTDNYFEAKVRRLKDIMQSNGHKKLDLLKLDIEGAEYKVLKSIIEDKLSIGILCVEYDESYNPIDKNYRERIKASINDLTTNGYQLVFAWAGNYTFVTN